MLTVSIKKIAIVLVSSMAIATGFNVSPSLADDPFRNRDRRNIGDNTEAAFIAFFQKGDYLQGEKYLDRASKSETNEPLFWTLKAGYDYVRGKRESIEKYAVKIRETAGNIVEEDPVRGNLYEGVAYLIEGAKIYETQGALNSIGKIQKALKEFDEAEKNDPEDPEYNLYRGYVNLLMSVNLPFSSPEDAIFSFEKYAAPNYLVDRGIALAYRDLKKYESALEYAEKALENAPDNPELYYLKGQILRILGTKKEDKELLQQALDSFEIALSKANQLPSILSEPIQGEYEKTQDIIAELTI
jgi:tetratricopeptide (TPR) repeat protein